MNYRVQKKIAAKLLKVSPKKIKIDTSRAEDLKEAITKKDIRGLIKEKAIKKTRSQEKSRSRTRKTKIQKSKGKRKNPGSRKGKITARVSKKDRWAIRIRAQRKFIKELRDKKEITNKLYSDLYRKSKGGYFRSKRHIIIYLEEHGLKK